MLFLNLNFFMDMSVVEMERIGRRTMFFNCASGRICQFLTRHTLETYSSAPKFKIEQKTFSSLHLSNTLFGHFWLRTLTTFLTALISFIKQTKQMVQKKILEQIPSNKISLYFKSKFLMEIIRTYNSIEIMRFQTLKMFK